MTKFYTHPAPAPAQEPVAVAVPAGWTLADLHRANAARQDEWCPDQKPDLSFRGNELAGEIGEACNVIKKLERERHGWAGSRDTVEHLAEELADGIMCIDLTANAAGISGESLMAAVVKKFNAVSEARGFKTMLAAAPVSPAADSGDVPRRHMRALAKRLRFMKQADLNPGGEGFASLAKAADALEALASHTPAPQPTWAEAARRTRNEIINLVEGYHVWQGSNDLIDSRTRDWLVNEIRALPLPTPAREG